jgi:[CysO sulfur-carrier protein]-S-L-cysteine hydrolase
VLAESRESLRIGRPLVAQLYEHARAARPAECCGLLGGCWPEVVSVYRLRNVAPDPLVAYEADPEELFDAQRRMRAAGQSLLAIYHSHPRAPDPVPSPADVKLAFYPAAVYLIIGFGTDDAPVIRAFRIFEREGRWEPAALVVEG